MKWIFFAAAISGSPQENAVDSVSWKFSRPPVIETHSSFDDPFHIDFRLPVQEASRKEAGPCKNKFCQCRPGYQCGCLDGEPCKCVGIPTHYSDGQSIFRISNQSFNGSPIAVPEQPQPVPQPYPVPQFQDAIRQPGRLIQGSVFGSFGQAPLQRAAPATRNC